MGGYLARMDIGVPVFFALSGFLLFRPIAVAVVDRRPLRPALTHLWRRALRIYPAFWVALFLIVTLTSESFRDTTGAVVTSSLVHIHWPTHVIGPMPQAWSLATEVTFYALLPILGRLLRPWLAERDRDGRVRGLFTAVAILYLVSVGFRLFLHGLANRWTSAGVLWLPGTLDYFSIGMTLAVAHVGFRPGTPRREQLERWAAPAGWWWLAAVVVFAFVAQGLGLARGLAVASWPRELTRQFLYGVIGMMLLFPLVFGGNHRGWLRRLVESPVFEWTGKISYSIYVWHMVFIVHPWGPMDRLVDRVWNATFRTDGFESALGWTGLDSFLSSPFVVLLIVALVPTICVAAVSYHLVERAGLAAQSLVRRPPLESTPSENLVTQVLRWWRGAAFRVQMASIAAAGLALRVAYVLIAKSDQTLDAGEVFPGDQFYYSLAADALADGRGFVIPWWADTQPAADHPPLTALVATPVSFLPGSAGTHVLEQRLTMCVVGVAAIVMIGLLAREVAGRGAGILAAALAAVYPGFWINDGLVMAESLTTALVAGALWSAVRHHRAQSTRLAVEMGGWIGLAALARAESLLLIPLVVLPVIWRGSNGLAEWLRHAAAAVAVASVVLAPWVVPNLVRFEEPVVMSTNDGLTLIGANSPQAYGGDAIGFWTLEYAETLDTSGLDQSEVSRVYRQEAFSYIGDHASELPQVVAARVGRVWSLYRPLQMLDWNQGEGRELWASMLALGGYLLVVPFAAYGWLVLRREGVWAWPLTAMLVQVTVVAALFYGLTRFRVTAEISLVVFAAVGVVAATNLATCHRAPTSSLPPSSS